MFLICILLAAALLLLGIGNTFRLIGAAIGILLVGVTLYVLGWMALLGLIALIA